MSKYPNNHDTYYQTNSQFILSTKDKFILAIENNNINEIENIPNYSNFIAKNSVFCLLAAANNTKIFEYLLKNGANINAHSYKAGDTVLHMAVYKSNLELVKLCIKNAADPNITNYNIQTPFFIACNKGFFEIARYLSTLDYIDLHKKNHNGLAPIHLVCQKGDIELLELFLNKSSPDQPNSIPQKHSPKGFVTSNKLASNTALYIAVSNNHFLITEKLLKNNSDPNKLCPSGSTALHISTNHQNFKIAQLLINHKANTNIKNIHGETPIFTAIENFDLKMIKLLLKNDAKIEIHNNRGDFPLKPSIKFNKLNIVELAFKYITNVNFQDKKGKTYLHIAAKNCQNLMIDFLIKKQADIYLSDYKGTNNLHYSNKDLTLFKFFYKQGLCIKSVNDWGCNSIHYATSTNSIEVVEFLIENKINVNLQDNQGWSPLSIACRSNFFELVKLLVTNKATLDIYNKHNFTPLYIAINNTQPDHRTIKIVELLIKHGADVPMFYTSNNPKITYFLNIGKFVCSFFENELDNNWLKHLYETNGLKLQDNMDNLYYENRENSIEFISETIKTKVYKLDRIEKIQECCQGLVKNFKTLGTEDCISVNCQFVFKFQTIPLKILALLSSYKHKSEIKPPFLHEIKSFYDLKNFLDPNFDLFKPLFEQFWPEAITLAGDEGTEVLDI